ncbi:MAG TPA: hypothetical protein VH092_16235 [Urbifossiella sp.]|nr:hypothetical protein [Urbifossiella sp.]
MSDDIDGVWTGFYTHSRRRFGITARFAPTGRNLRGAMTDAVLVHEYTLSDLRADHGLTGEQADAILAAIRVHVPQAEADHIVSVRRLPQAAELNGYVHGAVVRFRKQYQGECWGGWRVEWRFGPQTFGDERPGHAVEYEGELSADGNRIGGRWWIPANAAADDPGAEGTFELRRGR